MASSLDVDAPASTKNLPLRPLPLWAAFLLASAVFTAAGTMNYQAVQTLVTNQQLQARQRSVAIELQNLLRLAIEAETGQRGFVITGADNYLAPYEEAHRQLPQSIARLRNALADDAGQLDRLDQVATLQQAKFDELALSIATRRERGFEAAQRIVLTNLGKETMDRLRTTVADMDAIERSKLVARMSRSSRSAEQAFRSVIVAGILDVALMLLLFLLVRADALRRMRASQRLADSRALLRNVIDSLPVLLWLKDRDGSIRMENRAARSLLGNALRTSGDEARERQALATRAPVNFEEERATPLGPRHFLSSRVPLHDHRGEVIGVCAVASDVTALKQTQQALYELNRTLEQRVQERTAELWALNLRLEETNAQLHAYDFSVAHDLRAPLRAIHGFAEAIAEDHGPKLDAGARDYLGRIARAAERMERLVDDLLAYSRLSSAELPLEPVDLDALLAALHEDFREALAAAQATLEIAPALGAVQGNRLACAQALQNLLSNAIKFRDPQRRQHIRIWSEAAPGEAAPGEAAAGEAASGEVASGDTGRLRLFVADRGIGLSEEDAQRVFQPFTRLHGVHDYPGSGIGLAIVERAMRRMHGSCGASPARGGGACFWIELPRANDDNQGDRHRYSAH